MHFWNGVYGGERAFEEVCSIFGTDLDKSVALGYWVSMIESLHINGYYWIPIDSGLIFSFAGSVLVYGREQLLL